VTTKAYLLGLAVVFVCVGCSTFKVNTAEDYDRGQTPPAQFSKDGEMCAKMAESDQKRFGAGGEIDLTQATYNRMFDACMRASGYQRKQP